MKSHKICCRSSSSTIQYWILFFWFGCGGFGNHESGCLNLISPNSSCQKKPLLSSNPLLDSEHTGKPLKNLIKKECGYFQKLKRDPHNQSLSTLLNSKNLRKQKSATIQESVSTAGSFKSSDLGKNKTQGCAKKMKKETGFANLLRYS